jgi:hypothetical protein
MWPKPGLDSATASATLLRCKRNIAGWLPQFQSLESTGTTEKGRSCWNGVKMSLEMPSEPVSYHSAPIRKLHVGYTELLLWQKSPVSATGTEQRH